MEVGQTRWALRMLDANLSEEKDSLVRLLIEQFVSGYVQLHRRKCLEVYTYNQPNCLCPGGVLWEPGEDAWDFGFPCCKCVWKVLQSSFDPCLPQALALLLGCKES